MRICTLDIGGTFIKHAGINEMGTILMQGKVAIPRQGNQEDFLNCVDQIIETYGDIQGIAISLPGTIDVDLGYVIQGGSLRYLSNTNLKQRLEQRYAIPVELENDARCAAIAELTCGNLKDITNAIVLTFGTGIGGCFIFDGKIYRGSHYAAGEVSVMITKDVRMYGLEGVWGSASQGSVPGLIKRLCEAKEGRIPGWPNRYGMDCTKG